MEKKIAVIPWGNVGLNDTLFYEKDKNQNIVPRKSPLYDMQQVFIKNGDQFHTIDQYTDLLEIDLFLFFELDWIWVKRIIDIGSAAKMVYCNGEPPVVTAINCPKGYRFLANFFPYILTWNEDWIDNETIFKRNIPYYFETNMGNIRFEERKLLTGISGNKKSSHPDELYSEREKVYSFFEENYPDEFDFYGTGWDYKKHSGYKGRVEDKSKAYHKYRFAICFENMKGIKDYVTEKIWDCLGSGIVPIYAGAENIEQYVPKECYIDYFEFENCEKLATFLLGIGEEEYQKYIKAAQHLLATNIKEKFSGEVYAKNVYTVINHPKLFKIKWYYKLYVKIKYIDIIMIQNLKVYIKKLLDLFIEKWR